MKHLFQTTIMTLVLAMVALGSYAQDTKVYVDLGLPSGTLWATCNVGASFPEQVGNYYAWGETETKEAYTQANYVHGAQGRYIKYCTLSKNGTVDNRTRLEAADDAATANWGSEWCMPTAAQLQELLSCTKEDVTENGVACTKFTGPNDNYILLPKAGYKGTSGLDLYGQILFYSSSDLDQSGEEPTDNYSQGIAQLTNQLMNCTRWDGAPVRAVRAAKYTLSNNGTTLTINESAELSEVKTALGEAVSDIAELYITGDYTTTASIDALKTTYFPNLAKVHLTLKTSATSIAGSAYKNCTLLTEIIVPNTITTIGSAAFSGCSGLESMTLPFVGGSATATSASKSTVFGYIFGTSSYTGGTSTTQYYSSSSSSICYYDIPSSLKSVTITGGKLLYGAFYGCSGLTSIILGDGVTSIGERAFYNCSGLTNITIGDNVVYNISATEVFYNCNNLIADKDGLVYSGTWLLKAKDHVTDITVKTGTKYVVGSAFKGCVNLTNVTIPNSVISIGSSAFSGCSSLESMTLPFVGGSATATYSSSLFGYVFGTTSYTGGTSTKQYYSSSSYSTYYIPSSLKSVTITGGNLLYGAFSGCSGLASVSIPDGVTSIGDYAFYGCSGLPSVTIGENVASIGAYAFYGCSGLTQLEIPASVKSIGEYGLNTNSENLVSLTLFPNSIPELQAATGVHTFPLIIVPAELFDAYLAADNWKEHSGQFVPIGAKIDYNVEVEASNTQSSLHVKIGEQNLQNVVSLKVKGTINSYDLMIINNKMIRLINLDLSEASIVANDYEYSTGYCSHDNTLERYSLPNRLESLKLPNTLVKIGDYAFEGLEIIKQLVIPDGVTSIGGSAFSGCSGLTSVTIPDGVTSISSYTFQNCSGLTGITIWGGIVSIGAYAFSGCSSLKSVTIQDGVTSIGACAFSGCSGLKQITIPNSVTSIGYRAFTGCSSLEAMTLPFTGASATEQSGTYSSLLGYIFDHYEWTGGTKIRQAYSSAILC